jgi:hypothetical protein
MNRPLQKQNTLSKNGVFMKNKKHRRLGLIFLTMAVGLFALAKCDSGNNPPPPPPPGDLELLYPKGGSGQSFRVGDTVNIRWAIHDTVETRDIGLSYSLDGGKTVPGTQLISNHSISYPNTTYQWIIDSIQKSDEFVVCIWRYSETCISASPTCTSPHDRSAPFIVRK